MSKWLSIWTLVASLASPYVQAAEFSAYLQELSIFKNGSLFYLDSFDNGVPPPSGGAFNGSTAATYGVNSAFTAADEIDGRLRLNTADGIFTVNSAGNPRLGQSLTLRSSITPPSATALSSADTFEARALFTLLAPGVLSNGDTYAMWFSDVTASQLASDRLDIWVSRSAGVESVRFVRQDFANNQLTVLGAVNVNRAQSPDSIELRLARASLVNNSVTASFRYWKDGSPLTTDFTDVPFGASADRSIFNGESFTRVGLHTTTTGIVDAPRSYVRDATIATNVTFTVAPDAYIQPSGETIVNGTFSAGSPDAVAILLEGGLVGGSGSIIGTVVQTGGVLNPGNSPGTLSMSNYNLSGGQLEIEIASASLFDKLVVTETAILNGGLKLIALGGFKPALGSSFEFLTAADIQGGFTGSIELVGLAGYQFQILDSGTSLSAQVVAVPEPSAYALMLAGLGLIACAAYRRNTARTCSRVL